MVISPVMPASSGWPSAPIAARRSAAFSAVSPPFNVEQTRVRDGERGGSIPLSFWTPVTLATFYSSVTNVTR